MLDAVGMDSVAEHEYDLVSYAIARMKEIPGVIIYGPVDDDELRDKVGVISFDVVGVPHAKVAAILSVEGGIGVRNGCFCAHPYVKRLLKLSEEDSERLTKEMLDGDRTHLPGMVRASFGCYNNREDVDRLITMLQRIATGDFADDYELDSRSGTYWPKDFDYAFAEYFPHFSFRPALELTDFNEAS